MATGFAHYVSTISLRRLPQYSSNALYDPQQNMDNEIERKFFIKEMPDLSHIKPLHYERYFLKRGDGVEERISKVNGKCFYEKKSEVSDLERTREKKEITPEEFEDLKQSASAAIVRERYDISSSPKISIQIYHGQFEGLVRVEVEFSSQEEACAFQPLPWMGQEMTGLPIARDAKLLNLSVDEFKRFVQ